MDLPISKNICCHIITYYKKGGASCITTPLPNFYYEISSTPKSQGKNTQNSILSPVEYIICSKSQRQLIRLPLTFILPSCINGISEMIKIQLPVSIFSNSSS